MASPLGSPHFAGRSDPRLEADERLVSALRDLQAEVRDLRSVQAGLCLEVAAMRSLLERRTPASADERHARLLAALAASMEDLDLPFDATEVLGHAAVHHRLAEALRECGVSTTADLGALFRSLRGRDLGGLRLIRDGRMWRLERTSCT